MEPYIIISNFNDFAFCPRSIYFHNLYGKYSDYTYKQSPQIVGSLNHTTIDTNTYSSLKRYITALAVWSNKYKICGKIDIYDVQTQTLIERKTKIKTIYDGYRYQIYAQYFCLQEMGYEVRSLKLHSLEDNKRYTIAIPGDQELMEFEELLTRIRLFNLSDKNFKPNPQKCKRCIYSPLCDFSPF